MAESAQQATVIMVIFNLNVSSTSHATVTITAPKEVWFKWSAVDDD
jgi:hypothetical protein